VSFGNGVGTATEYYGDETAATPTITANNGSNTWGTTTVTITARTSGDTMTIVQGSPQSATVNTPFATALEVLDQDQFGNPVPNVSLTFAAPSSGASGTFGTCSGGNGGHTYQCIVSTNPSGNATAATFTANTISGGPYNVTTSASGVASPPSFAETNTTTQTKFVLTPATTTPTAGALDNLTIVAEDQYNNVISSYTGSHNLTFGGASASLGGTQPTVTNASGTAVNFGTATAITFTNGTASVTGSNNGVMTLYDAQTTNITVTDQTYSNGGGTSVTVSPKPADSGGSLTLSAAAPTTAGSGDNLTITALDQYGNQDTNYSGSKSLTFSGASAIGLFTPTVTNSSGTATNFGLTTAISFTSGQATVSGSSNGQMVLYKATTSSIMVSDGTINNGGGLSVTVNPSTLNSFTWSALSTTTPTAGSSFTATLSALDAYGNAASGYISATQCVTFSGPANSPAPSSTAPLYPAKGSCATGQSSLSFNASGQATGISFTLYDAQTTSITATSVTPSGKTGTSPSLTVSAGSLNSFTVPTPSTQTAGTPFNETITALDAWDNPASGWTSGTECVTFSGPSNSPNATAPVYGSQGSCASGQTSLSFIASGQATASITLSDAQTNATLTVTSVTTPAGKTGSSGTFTVNAKSTVSTLAIANVSTPQTAGMGFGVTVTANDAYGNTANNSTDSVILGVASGSPQSNFTSITTNPAMLASGIATFSGVTFDTAGTTYALTANDGSVTAPNSNTFTVQAASAVASLSITNVSSPQMAGSGFTVTVTAKDTYGNPDTTSTDLITLSILAGSGQTTFSNNGLTTMTANLSSGTATFSGVTFDAAGSYQLSAKDATVNVTAPNSNTFSVQASTSNDKLVFVAQPSSTYAATAISPSVTVQVEDSFGNAVPDNNFSITLTPSANTISSGAVASTNSSGLATFSGITIDVTGLGLTLTAAPTNSGTGVSASSASSSFNVTALVTNSLNALTDTASDAGSGVASVAYYYCSGYSGSCTSGNWTPIVPASGSTSPYTVTWTSQPADGAYQVVAVGTDNAGNVSGPSTSIPVTVDNTAPTVSDTFPANGAYYNASGWTNGGFTPCGTTGTICGTATDATSGIAQASSISLTITQSSTGYTWNGSAFASDTHTVTATTYNSGTGAFTYTFPNTDFAGNGTYTVLASATDRAGKTGTSATNTFTYNTTPPTVVSINTTGTNPTNTGPLAWQVTFSEPVTGVVAADFGVVTSGTSGTTPTVSSVTGSGSTYTVSVSTTGTTGSYGATIGLNLTSTGTIADLAGNALSGTTPVVGQTYTYVTTAPTVTSIVRAGATPTNATSLSWTVTFSEPVVNVVSGDFALAMSGLGGTVPSITSLTGSGTTYTVNASTSGTTATNGSIGLNLTSKGTIADLAGNGLSATTPVVGQTYLFDTVAPTVSATVIGQSSGAVVTGVVKKNTGYYIYANATDTGSGVATVTANVANVTSGQTAVSLSSSGGPFTAPGGGGTYTYRSALLTSNPSQSDGAVTYTVNATDNAGNTSSYANNGSVTFDSTAPTGTVTFPTNANGYVTGSAVSVSFAAADGTGSGVNASSGELLRASTTLTGGTCGSTYSSYTQLGSTGLASPYNDTVASGNCYEYEYIVSDNVGNQATIASSVMKVDTGAPALSVSSTGANVYATGTTVYYRATGSPTGSFTLTVTDTPSGISAETFPTITGWTKGSVTTTSTSASDTYTITSSATGGSESVSATNGAGTAASGLSVTLTSYTTALANGAVTVNSVAAGSAGTTSSTPSTSFTIGSRTDWTAANPPGLASSTLTVQSETFSSNTCGAAGSGGPFTSPQTITGTTEPSGIAAGYCYLYTLTGTDNVGNTASISTTVEVYSTITLSGTCSSENVSTNTSTASNSCSAAAEASGTTLTIDAPSSLTPGNVLIAQVTVRVGSASISSSGWTLIQSDTNGTLTQDEFYHDVASGDPSSWIWSWSGSGDGSGGILEFGGVANSGSPVDVMGDNTGTSGTSGNWTATAPLVTTTVGNDEILAFFASGGGENFSGATYVGEDGAALKYSAISNNAPACNGVTAACESDAAGVATATVQTSAGSTGTFTLTQGYTAGSGFAWNAATIAIKP